MDEILCVLLCHLRDLYKTLGFRFSDSAQDEESFGNAYIIMENEKVRILLGVDRGQLEICLLPRGVDTDWIPLETLADYLKFPLLTKSYSDIARTLFAIYPKVEEVFSDSTWKTSRDKLADLGRILGVHGTAKGK